MEKKTKLVPVSKEVLDYLNQEIEKPLTPQQMMETELSRLRKSKTTFNNHLRGIIEYILLQPIEDRKNLERDVVDAINQLHYNNNY